MFTTAQTQFAAEFVTLVVAAAGLGMVVLPNQVARSPRWCRILLVIAFVAIGNAAFLHGSLIVASNADVQLGALRVIGDGCLVAGALGFAGGYRARALMVGGAAIAVVGDTMALGAVASWESAVVEAAGSLVIGSGLISASKRSIASRVAAATAGTLLLVVLVLSVSLSAVISSSVRHQQLQQLEARARTEAVQISSARQSAVKDAAFVAADLLAYFRSSTPNPLSVVTGPEGSTFAAAQEEVAFRLQTITSVYTASDFAYVTPSGSVIAATANDLPPGPQLLASVGSSSCTDPNGSVVVSGGHAWAAGAACLLNGTSLLATVVSATPLNAAYLAQRYQVDATVSLALVAGGRSLASRGTQPESQKVVSLAETAQRSGQSASLITSAYFIVAEPVSSVTAANPAALVLSFTTTSLTTDNNRLLQALFIIALGGTILALLLAAVTGDRITIGVRRLTLVAQRMRSGETDVRAGSAAFDEVGLLGGALDSMVDTVESRNEALREAAEDETRLRNRLQAVVAGMSDALVATDSTGVITDFNRAAEQLTGVKAANAVGRPVEAVLEMVSEAGQPMARRIAKSSEDRWAAVARLTRADRTEVPVAITSGALIGPAGELAGAALVLRDLRRERELERMKAEFLSRVGHELRTPLTSIMGYSEILRRLPVSAEQAKDWHAEILTGARRLLRVVEMLEFFSSSVGGADTMRPELLDVGPLVNGIASVWAAKLPPGHHLVRRVDPVTPRVLADRRLLSLAIDELLDNAVKFSPEGGRILVTATAAGAHGTTNGSGGERPPHPTPPTAVEISVTDRGRGMTEEELALAFGEFAQGDSSDTRRFGGLGLGLALVQRVVESQGGEVTCRSTPGKGSTFTIRLAARDPDLVAEVARHSG
ncbi:MAG: sensor histidine kinase [Acidimicrobiales bacterium]